MGMQIHNIAILYKNNGYVCIKDKGLQGRQRQIAKIYEEKVTNVCPCTVGQIYFNDSLDFYNKCVLATKHNTSNLKL